MSSATHKRLLGVFVLLLAQCASIYVALGEETNGIPAPSPKAVDLLMELAKRRTRVGEYECTLVHTIFSLGAANENLRLKFWVSKSRGLARVEQQLRFGPGRETTLTKFWDASRGVIYYRLGHVVAQSTPDEASKMVRFFWAEPDLTFESKYVYQLPPEQRDGKTVFVFAIAEARDGTGLWKRIWVDPGNGFVYREENFHGKEPSMLSVFEIQNLRVDHHIPEDFLRPDFPTENLPVKGPPELIAEYKGSIRE